MQFFQAAIDFSVIFKINMKSLICTFLHICLNKCKFMYIKFVVFILFKSHLFSFCINISCEIRDLCCFNYCTFVTKIPEVPNLAIIIFIAFNNPNNYFMNSRCCFNLLSILFSFTLIVNKIYFVIFRNYSIKCSGIKPNLSFEFRLQKHLCLLMLIWFLIYIKFISSSKISCLSQDILMLKY